jgi:hypothetical protein
VYKVDGSISPPLYYLQDLMKAKIDGTFYKEQLYKTTPPDFKKDFFEIEKVISVKKFQGKKFYLVKFLFYSAKFNQYIPEENMKFSEDLSINQINE